MENVDGILFKENLPNLQRWIARLTDMGYTSAYAVLNAKDYGVPQNRKRCFMVSARGGKRFVFPAPCPDGRVLRDVLEDDVDGRYYLDVPMGPPMHGTSEDGLIEIGMLHRPGYYDSARRVYSPEGTSPTVTTQGGGGQSIKIAWPTGNERGYIEASEGDGVVTALRIGRDGRARARGTVQRSLSPTVTASCQGGCGTVVQGPEGLRVRRLTPRECWRLMGFTDEQFDRARGAGMSDTQLYKQAGNSIAVPVLKSIFEAILGGSWRTARTLDDYTEEI